jgi:lysozyme
MAKTKTAWTEIDAEIALEVISHEAIIRRAYKDSVGVWTWGPGITSASGHNVERYIDNPQPMEKVLAIYIWLLREKYLPAVLKAFTGYRLAKHELAAALSFHWNTGGIERATWVNNVVAGRIESARENIMAWNKPASIIGRREKERDLFFNAEWSNDGFAYEYVRLNKNYSPVWSSRIKVDVKQIVEDILNGKPTVVETPVPQIEVSEEQLVATPVPVATEPTVWERIKAWFARFFS